MAGLKDNMLMAEVSDCGNDSVEEKFIDADKESEVLKLTETPDGDEREAGKKREKWDRKSDFLLSIIGFAVDLANVWRFPYLCYKNGGGAFLIPYFIMQMLLAVPLLYMELLLGQFHQQGAISLWKIVPIFKGVGWTIVSVSFLVSFYYNTIIAWSLYYFFASFTLNLPWTSCNNDWNTCQCWTGETTTNATNFTTAYKEGCFNVSDPALNKSELVSSTKEFFERKMLKIHESSGFDDIGMPMWDVTLCLVLAYVIIYFATFKSVKSSGKLGSELNRRGSFLLFVECGPFLVGAIFCFASNKISSKSNDKPSVNEQLCSDRLSPLVVYVTAVMPYVILLILFIRGLFLEGSVAGMRYFVEPKIHLLRDSQVWITAAFQVFYSVGAGFGVHLAMASYNELKNNCFMDCLITATVNAFTSLFSGCTVFIYLGYMSVTMDRPIEEVASHGPSLVFEVYPQAIATLPGSTFWSLLFFFMLIMLGMDSSMGGIESVATGIIDEFGGFFKKYKWHRELFMLVILSVSFLASLASVTKGGLFAVTLLDNYAAGTSLLLVVFFEAIGISWFYGLDQFLKDAEVMLGVKPGIYWRICWKFVSPIFLLGIVIASCLPSEPLTVVLADRTLTFPPWLTLVGWMFVLAAFLWVPAFAIYTIFGKYKDVKSWKTRFALAISPVNEHKYIINGGKPKRFKLHHWINMGYHTLPPSTPGDNSNPHESCSAEENPIVHTEPC